jgi:hypothetical protein
MRSARIQLSAKHANIDTWGWQKDARFRYAVCGRRFGKTYLGVEEMRRRASGFSNTRQRSLFARFQSGHFTLTHQRLDSLA